MSAFLKGRQPSFLNLPPPNILLLIMLELSTLVLELPFILSLFFTGTDGELSSVWQIGLSILFGLLSLPWLYFALPLGWALSFCSSFCIIIVNAIWLIADNTSKTYLIYTGNILAYLTHLILLNLPDIRHPFLHLSNRTWLVLKRYPTSLPVKVWVRKKAYAATMLDISRSGCRLSLESPLQLGERLEIDISRGGDVGGEDLIQATALKLYGEDLGCRFAEKIPERSFRLFYQSLENQRYLRREEDL